MFEKVTREHIIQGIKDFEEKEFPVGFKQSSTYDVLYEDKRFPPPSIMAYAYYHAEGKNIEPGFKVGKGSECFVVLERNGFEIVKKKSTSMKKEFINWLVNNPRHNYYNNDKDRLEEALDYYNTFFDRDIYDGSDINELKRFIKSELYDKASSKFLDYSLKTSNHLPRAILGNKNYIKFLNEKLRGTTPEIKSNEFTWVKTHLELAEYLKDYKDKQPELIALLKTAGVTEFTDKDKEDRDIDLEEIDPFTFFCYIYKYGSQRRLQILQSIAKALNIHYPSDEKGIPSSNAQKVWLFPYKYQRVNNEMERLWTFFYSVFNDTITNEAFEDLLKIRGIARTKLTEALFNVNPEKYFPINGPTKPYLKEVFGIEPKFKTFEDYKKILRDLRSQTEKPFYQLSYEAWLWNESKNKQQTLRSDIAYWLYSPGKNAEHWDEFYNNNIMAIGWDELGDLTRYNSRDEIYEALKQSYGGEGDKKNNVTANHQFCHDIEIGDIIIIKQGRHNLLGYGEVSSDYYFDSKRAAFKSCRDVNWKTKGKWYCDHSMVVKTLTDITSYDSEREGSKKYYEYLMSIMERKEEQNPKEVLSTGCVNQIFYGPPGTGKTYALKRDLFPLYTTKETSIGLDQHFESVVKECSWWEVIAIALLQLGKSKVNDIFNHKWVQKKAELSNSNTVKPTLWGQLQSHTIEECNYVNVKSKQQPLIFNKTEDSSWEILKDKVDNEVPELYELINKVENFNPSPDKEIKRYKFVTFHQSFSYEDFIEGIKPVMSDNTEISEDLGYKIEDGIFKEICKDAALDHNNRYAIFIDEISRGNVSAIFGELITLIEKDKRGGAINEMSIELPYSKKKFSVPSNLDIYGTMNTADRSVEALDTALRRRFEFKEMMPDVNVIEGLEVEEVSLSEVLNTINKRIELLVDRDHTIGHSYFVNADTKEKLADSFNNKIVPLLQEYFYGDYGKIGLVLGKGFVETIKNDKITFADFGYENSEDFKIPSYNLKTINPENIIDALHQLLNKPVEEN